MPRFLLSSAGMLAFTMILACGGAGQSNKDKVAPTTAAEKKHGTTIEYRNVAASGLKTVIVIDPSHRNEKDMRLLGDQLRSSFGKERIAVVIVFDDDKAALMNKDVSQGKLSKQNEAHYDKHMIGTYHRNANTGHHAFQINLEGLDGPSIDIDYAN